jgi:hypothetical protein
VSASAVPDPPPTGLDGWAKRATIAAAFVVGVSALGAATWTLGASWANSWIETHIAPVRADAAANTARVNGHDDRLNAQFKALMEVRAKTDTLQVSLDGKLDKMQADIAQSKSDLSAVKGMLDGYFNGHKNASAAAFTDAVPARMQN